MPRHLGQHSGGMVIAAGRLDKVVPIEPASMAGRKVIQWDKEDSANTGIIKIDLLGLGMLAAFEDALPQIKRAEGISLDLSKLPMNDPDVFKLLQRADTVGVFQVESRAQMSMLPRLKPTCFYDLVVEIALVRPGPIVGEMVHPYLRRRDGTEAISYPHPSLEPALARTLGVPIFQEQIIRVAMSVANFSGGEAEELRRAMGFKRSEEKMRDIRLKLRKGMTENGIPEKTQEQIIQHISSFALYGFPESHSASFALIAYASAYLKVHHPAGFLAGLLNAWPMGFYHPSTLLKDAQRRGVRVLPIDIQESDWETNSYRETRCALDYDLFEASEPPQFSTCSSFDNPIRFKICATLKIERSFKQMSSSAWLKRARLHLLVRHDAKLCGSLEPSNTMSHFSLHYRTPMTRIFVK